MTIDRINSINSAFLENTSRNARMDRQVQTDSIRLSAEARERSELYQVSKMVNSADDIRHELVAEFKQRINDPSYINEAVLNATAEKILAVFGI